MLPGSTGRFYKGDDVHNHSAHGYYITRMEKGVRFAWYCCYMLTRIQQYWAKTAIHEIREFNLVAFHIKDYLSDEASKIDVRVWCKNSKTTCTWYSLYMLQQVTAEVQPRLAAQVNTAVSLDRTRMVNITLSHHFFCSWYVWQSTFHTPVVEEVAGPRDIFQAVLTAIFPSAVLQHLFECLPQSLPDITY